MQSLVQIKPDIHFVKPLASSRKYLLDRNPFRAKLTEYMSRFDHPLMQLGITECYKYGVLCIPAVRSCKCRMRQLHVSYWQGWFT